ncbi:MAG: hypothetical protein ACP5JG_14475 [Anaerolineae bacterium]
MEPENGWRAFRQRFEENTGLNEDEARTLYLCDRAVEFILVMVQAITPTARHALRLLT